MWDDWKANGSAYHHPFDCVSTCFQVISGFMRVCFSFITVNPFFLSLSLSCWCNLNHPRAINSGMLTNPSAYFLVAVFICWLRRFVFYGLWDFHLTTAHPSRSRTAATAAAAQWAKKVMIVLTHLLLLGPLRSVCFILRWWMVSTKPSTVNIIVSSALTPVMVCRRMPLYLAFKVRCNQHSYSMLFLSSRFNFLLIAPANWFPNRPPLGFEGNVYACEHTADTSQTDSADD